MSATPQGVEQSIHEKLMDIVDRQDHEETVADEVVDEKEEEIKESEEEVEASEDVVDESVEAEPSDVDDQGEEPSESQEIELSHIAEYLGATEDQFIVNDDGDLMIKTKIDGVEGKAKFSDILKSYQLEGHLNKQSTELAETQKALQTKLAEADGQLSQKIQQLEDLSQLAYNELLSDYNKVNWDELRADDPGEWSARQTDYKNRQSQIATLYQNAQDQRSEITATAKITPERIADEKSALLKAIPEWADETVFSKEWTSVGEYAVSSGFTAEEYQKNTDHRFIVLLNKAKQFDALNKESQEVTKQVRKAPKIAKPGSPATKVTSKQADQAKRMARIKRDGGGPALMEELTARFG